MKLPPLNALKAFESAARLESFLLAANELHVSAASISRFIKLLENDLKHPLFLRHPNGVSLTDAGKQYLRLVQPHLHSIAIESERFRQQTQKSQLTIVSIPAIAEIWLVSRLWSFQQQYKDIQINLVVDDQLVVNDELISLRQNEATIVLNYSQGNQADTQSYAMPKDELTLVCTQDIAKTLKKPTDVLEYHCLVDKDWQEDWLTWLSEAGLEKKIPTKHSLFERYSMVLHATLAGSGVAIGHTALLESYLKTGALVAPFNITAQSQKQFYALTAKNNQQDSVQKFMAWFCS